MKTKDLIEHLQTYDPDGPVAADGDDQIDDIAEAAE